MPDEIRAATDLIKQARRPRAIPFYSAEERQALAILRADFAQRQSAKGKARRAPQVAKVAHRRMRVSLLLRYVVKKKYRDDPKSLATVMEIVAQLDETGIAASESQVRRDIAAVLKTDPVPVVKAKARA
jgi:hypothetical protein